MEVMAEIEGGIYRTQICIRVISKNFLDFMLDTIFDNLLELRDCFYIRLRRYIYTLRHTDDWVANL